MSSRVDVAPDGRRIVVVVDATCPELLPGMKFRLLGNTFDFDGRPCWLGVPTGRPPFPAEMTSGAYCVPVREPKPRQRREPDDDELTDSEAVEWARREQQHAPPDLLAV